MPIKTTLWVTAGLLCLLPRLALAAPFFSEIMFDPAGTDTGLEYVEIHNPDAAAVDISGWSLTLRETTGASPSSRTVVFAAGTTIAPGGFLVAASSANLGGTASCNVAAATFGANFTVYNLSAPTVELFNGVTLVDGVLYRGAGFPTPASGRALTVVNLATGNDDPANWRNGDCRYNAAPQYGTPGSADQACADADIPALACLVVPDAGTPMDAGNGDAAVDLDAGDPPDAAPPVDTGVFVSEVFFDAPGTSDTNLEWVELFNPTAQDVDLAGFKIRTAVDRVTTLGAGAVVPAGGYLLLAQTGDLGGTVPCNVVRLDFGTVPTLGNSSGDFVELLTAADVSVDRVAYIGGGFLRPPGGSSLSVANVAAGNNAANLWVAGDCAYGERDYTGVGRARSFGTPGQAHQACGAMPDGGVTLVCLPTPDAGPNADAGGGTPDAAPRPDAAHLLEPRDASVSGNGAPTVMVTEPAAQTSSTMVTVNWVAIDPDGDTLSVSVLKAAVGALDNGDEVLTGLGAAGPATWDTTGVTGGIYRVLVRVDDGHGHVVVAEASGRVVVGGGATPLTIETPRGGESVNLELNIRVRTTATEGMVGVFYDSDSAGLDGTAIAGGIRPRGGNIDVTWNVANVPDGEYFIYAVLEGAGGTASAYSAGAVTVARARRCGCSTGGQDGVPAGAAVLAVFSCAWFKVRSARARRAPGA